MKKVFISSLVFGAILVGQVAHAYDTTAQSAVRLTDEYVLFTISYDFGFLNRAALIPYSASDTKKESSVVTYQIETASGSSTDIVSAGFVTHATGTQKGNFHYLPYGASNDYTLNVIATIPRGTEDYRLRITELPFILENTDGTLREGTTIKDSLAHYITPTIK